MERRKWIWVIVRKSNQWDPVIMVGRVLGLGQKGLWQYCYYYLNYYQFFSVDLFWNAIPIFLSLFLILYSQFKRQKILLINITGLRNLITCIYLMLLKKSSSKCGIYDLSTQEQGMISYLTNVFDHKTFRPSMLIKISRKHSLGTLPKATLELTWGYFFYLRVISSFL